MGRVIRGILKTYSKLIIVEVNRDNALHIELY